MKHILFLFLVLSCSTALMAQNFTELPHFAFDGVEYSALAFADIDGDGDEDVLITGDRGPAPNVDPITILYRNDAGTFIKVQNTPFPDVELGSVAFADIDNDGDQDVVITGEEEDGTLIAKLYSNTFGTFSEVENTPFNGVRYSSIAFADVNGDSYADLLITGEDKNGGHIAEMYINNTTGGFNEFDEPFIGVSLGSIAFADIDGDNDQDVLITGQDIFLGGNANLYINDGMGNFTISSDNILNGVYFSSVAFSDVDNDGDEDVLITGQVYSLSDPIDIAILYINNGSGVFTAAPNTPFVGVYESAIGFADVDGDGDEDVLISGETEEEAELTTLYINDGSGNFSVDTDNEFEGVYEGSIGFSDVDFDGDQDALITGEKSNGIYIAHLYLNDGEGDFTQLKGIPFNNVAKGSNAVADVNGDGYLDVLISGETQNELPFTHLYLNDGIGDFIEVLNTDFDEVSEGTVAFSDIDGDGDQDALVTGKTGTGIVAELYHNDGLGHFSLIEQHTLVEVSQSAAAFADVDNDGDEDLMITGLNADAQPTSNLYLNDGAGNFSLSAATFEAVSAGSIAFANVDGNDGLDVIITGQNSNNTRIARLYLNDGMGGFTESSATFTGVTNSDLAFADVDGDNDQDVFIMGREGTSSSQLLSRLYLNDGMGGFTSSMAAFENMEDGEAAFSDVDGDNDLDLLISGTKENSLPETRLYLNDGGGVFTANFDVPFRKLDFSTVTFLDIDGDSDEDVLFTGYDFNFNAVTRVYQNDLFVPLEEGAALDFDGVDDRVVVPHEGLFDDLTDFTISTWVKIDDNNQTQQVLLIRDNIFGGDHISMFANDAQLGNPSPRVVVRSTSGVHIFSAEEPLSVDEWHHLAFTVDAATSIASFYVDGALAQTISGVNAEGVWSSVNLMYLGYSNFSVVGGYFSGQMDECRILNKNSNCSEIQQLADCELPANDPNLVLYYQFNQDIANSANTTLSATVGSDGTMENFALMGMGSDFVEEGAVVTGTICDPVANTELTVTGSGISIPDGDDTPTADDGTDFGDVFVGIDATETFVIVNSGDAQIVVDGVTSSNGLFSFVTELDSVVIEPGASVVLEVAFSPDATGVQSSVITIITDDCSVGEYTFTVQGNGVPVPVCDPLVSIDFDGQGNMITVLPGTVINATGSYVVSNPIDCPNCFQQVIIGVEDDALDCVYDGQPETCPESTAGDYSLMINAPIVPGVYNVYSNNPFEFTCDLGAYDGANGNQALLIGTITVEQPILDGDMCMDAIDINSVFGGEANVPQTTGIYDNTGYGIDGDPDNGFECFVDGPTLNNTIWFTFEGDGNTYLIRTVACDATDYIDGGDTQAAIYSGDCGSLTPVACNDDEDVNNQVYNIAIELATEAGITYTMLMDGYDGADGEFCIEVTRLEEVVDSTNVTFQVDATNLVDEGTISAEGLYLAGSFNGFTGEPMVEGADNIWTLTLTLEAGSVHTYKFQNGIDGWETIDTSIGDDCTVGGYGDRQVEVGDMDFTTDLVCFAYCVPCNVVDVDEATLEASINVFPNPAMDVLNIKIDLPLVANNLNIRLMNALGQVVNEQYRGRLQSDNIELDLSNVPSGAYMLQVRDGQSQFTHPVIVQK